MYKVQLGFLLKARQQRIFLVFVLRSEILIWSSIFLNKDKKSILRKKLVYLAKVKIEVKKS